MPRMTFVEPGGNRREVEAPAGKTVLGIAEANDIDIEGACEGCMACATCHVIVEPAFYERMDPPTDAEEDMLDLAFDLMPTSRLGCQIVLTAELDGLVVNLPSDVRNLLDI